MTKKINDSNYNSTTKAVIFEAYKEVLTQLQEAQNQKLDPAREVAVKKTTETLAKAEDTASKSVDEQIASLQKNVEGFLVNLSNNFATELDAYNNVKESIELKKAELKELFDIEKEAFTLAALIDTNRELTAKQTAENNELQEKAQAELKAVNDQIAQARIDYEKQIKAESEALEIERKRENEEYTYEFGRKKQREKDALADELATERKEFEDEVAQTRSELNKEQEVLDSREGAVTVREEKMSELETQVAAFPAKEAQIRSEATEQGRKDAEKVSAIKESYVKKEYESQKAIYENKIVLLEGSLDTERDKNKELSTKLDAAYEKIQNMALASVDGSKAQAAAADLAKSIMNKQ